METTAHATDSGSRSHPVVVNELKKYYGRDKAVDGISFSVRNSEIFGLLGPNGAGKTTTMEAVVGLVARDSGVVLVDGRDPAADSQYVRSRIAVQLQAAAVFPRLTVREMLTLFAAFYPDSLGVEYVIGLVGLGERAKTLTAKLSGGQLQRLSVALALIGNGNVLFLDEPTTGMDPEARRDIWNLLDLLRSKGKTVILTTHSMDEAEHLCDRVAIIDRGKIIAVGNPKQLVRQYFMETAIEIALPEKYIHLDMNNSPVRELLGLIEGFPGVVRTRYEKGTICLFTTEVAGTVVSLVDSSRASRMPVENFTVRAATLEDVFLKLTGRRLFE